MIFFEIENDLNPVQLRGVMDLYENIFGTDKTEKVLHRLRTMRPMYIACVQDSDALVGFKIGYAIDKNVFYSWLGGVDERYRGKGIAAQLMTQQHDWCKRQGFKKIRTKTMNKWRNMLILNIKAGFDIVETYRDEHNILKIVLEKTL
jgi:predicted GNAT superfamily acetyltransferase